MTDAERVLTTQARALTSNVGPCLWILSCSLSLILPVTPAAAACFLINGNAEMGDLTGWTLNVSDSGFMAANQGDIGQNPYEGAWMFTSVYDAGSHASMSQTGTSGLTGTALNLSGWFMHEQSYGDYGRASLRIYDQTDQVLASTTTGDLDAGQNWLWAPFQLSLGVPLGAYRWEVEMIGNKGQSGSFPDVYFDALVLVPEPSTYAMIAGLALIGFAAYRRRVG